MIPFSGTFAYTGTIPAESVPAAGRWQLRDESEVDVSTVSDSLTHERLVGLEPTLEVTEAGVTPDARVSSHTGIVRPKVSLSRLTLRARERDRATVAAFSFCVDQAFPRSWRPGDVLHVARTGCGGLGLSVVRDGQLVTAVGAVTSVSLGRGATAQIPWEVIREAESVVRRLDPKFELSEAPVEVQLDGERRVICRGRPRIGRYEVFVEHGFYPDDPGTAECVAISLVGSCPEVPAVCSAQLLEYDDLMDFVCW